MIIYITRPEVPVAFRLDRHAVRRAGGTPTVSVLVGMEGIARRAWSSWATVNGRSTLFARNHFPRFDWLATAARVMSFPALAVRTLAHRLGRDPAQLMAEWRAKTAADRDRVWDVASPHPENVLRVLSSIPLDAPSVMVAESLTPFGDDAVSTVVRLRTDAGWPGVLFVAETVTELAAAADEATGWAVRVPDLPLAVTVPTGVWAEYLETAPDGRVKAILREGDVMIAGEDVGEAERLLGAMGVSGAVRAALSAGGTDEALATAAAEVRRATATTPDSEEADDRARSAAEAILFRMLESLPETAGRFELNGELDFRFGPRTAEVDLLCRELRLAVEIDGYYHFGEPTAYRRDRTKDWELQRRGFVVLRFLAADVLPRYEEVRDRILDAVRTRSPGGAG